jgi:hypothetical protein
MNDDEIFRIERDETEKVNNLWQREYDLRNEETFHDKSEGYVDAALAIVIIGSISFVTFQLSLPYVHQFFQYISRLSTGF